MDTKSSLAPAAPAEVTFIIDRSGSMQSIADDVNGGFASFVRGQAPETLFNVVQFDNEYEVVFDKATREQAQDFRLQPRGATALLDAIGRTLNDLRTRYQTSRPGRIVVAIVTDGFENASREFSHEQVSKLIEEFQAADYEFVFLAADQNAIQTGRSFNIRGSKSISFAKNPVGVHAAFMATSNAVRSYTSGVSTSVEYSAEDRLAQTLAGVPEGLNDVTSGGETDADS